jgi:sugar/nucleoside kinase (ribokinase family)
VFTHDLRAQGVRFDTPPLEGSGATARSLINVTPDGQRTMSTFLGVAGALGAADVDEAIIKDSAITYLEGYLFDPPPAREAFELASKIARQAGRKVAITLSDVFVVERWRQDLLDFLSASAHLVFANEAELKALFETQDFDEAVSRVRTLAPMAAVTRGEKGSIVLDGGKAYEVEAYAVDAVVDTTGAGDQYAAGFMFGLAQGRSPDDCARLGALAAAEVIGHYGPRPMVSLKDLAAEKGLV